MCLKPAPISLARDLDVVSSTLAEHLTMHSEAASGDVVDAGT